jgi:hypothetical protein
MSTYSKTIIVSEFGRDQSLKRFDSGGIIYKFSVATMNVEDKITNEKIVDGMAHNGSRGNKRKYVKVFEKKATKFVSMEKPDAKVGRIKAVLKGMSRK